jgi:hypothetical protein
MLSVIPTGRAGDWGAGWSRPRTLTLADRFGARRVRISVFPQREP